ncbi:hypothetical protein [Mycoplasmopsis cricetuli]|uniref:hypothetical protein n=1 Tax=Mycoplasmopsis cricetuli TaxID=171283 RepID=UPI00046EA384|nr:hypothetical protein [Mycoplasmopsis cricetuli]
MKIANIEKIKLIAESLQDAQKEVRELKRELNNLVKNTEVEINEPLANGGRIIYKRVTPKPTFNYRQYSVFLHTKIQKSTLTEQELNDIMKEFTEQKADKWKLKIEK